MRRITLCLAAIAILLAGIGQSPLHASHMTIGLNFTGSNRSQSGFIPPDTMGAVGNSHIVEILNGRYAVYNKANGTLAQSSTLNTFWTNAGVTPAGSFAFDPRILFDPSTQRWFAASVDNSGGNNNFLVGVSNSADPTAGWTGFKIDSDPTNTRWADFPTMGINGNGVYVAANMFPIAAGSVTTNLLVLPKTDLVAGSVANRTLFNAVSANSTGFSIQPVVDVDNSSLPETLLSSFNTPAGSLKTSTVTGTINTPTLTTAGGFIGVAPFNSPLDADQPGPKQNIDTGDTRFSGNAVLQNGSIWAVQSVDNGGRSAIRWFEIQESTNGVLQSGLISDLNLAFYRPSIAVNDNGDVVIGYSGSSASQFVSSYASVGQTALGVTTFESPLLLKAGLSDYLALDSFSRNRWGDYSATVVDPLNPGIFWTFQEFVLSSNVWGVQITQLSTVPEPSTVSLLVVSTLCLIGYGWRRRRMDKAA